MSYQGPPAAGAVALSYPAAQHALLRYRQWWAQVVRVSWIVTAACVGGIIVGILAAAANGGDAAYTLGGGLATLLLIGGCVSGILAIFGSQTLRKADQMQWVMSHYPWVERHSYDVERHRNLIVTLHADQNGPTAACLAAGSPGPGSSQRLQASTGYQPLLVAGDPYQLAVMTTPMMQDLYLLRPNMPWT